MVAGASPQPFPRGITAKKSLGLVRKEEISQATITKIEKSGRKEHPFNDGRLDNSNLIETN
jgi:hypothetical protein